jgi:hypothetical protein
MKKYAYANVKIPLEVLPNGNFELLKEYIQVEFTHCNELPPKQELNIDFSSILNDLFTQDKININQENEREIKIKNIVEEQEPQNDDENEPQKEPEPEIEHTEKQQEVEKMIILSSEIKKYKNMNKNTSFKNRKNSYNYTNKSRY